jgi:predicted PurR-regulated permease PerM
VIFCAVVFISGRIILAPLLISLTLAYLLAPVVVWFERRGWSRPSSALLAITSGSVLAVLILIFVLPSFWVQLTKSYEQARALARESSRVEPVLEKVKQASPPVYDYLQSQIEHYRDPAEQQRIRNLVGEWLQSGLFKLVDLTGSILDLLLIPFFVFYLLSDYGAMRTRVDRLIPPRYRTVAAVLIGRINNVISSYIRNQLLIALVMGTLYSIGFAILSVPLAFTIGMLSGLLNFIPYLGTLTGFALSISFAALDGAGLARLAGVFAIFIIVQSLEGYYLTPKLLGSRLNLHPMWVLTGLMIGGNLFGLIGIILAVPVIAIAKVVLNFLEEIYQQSDFYRNTGHGLLTEMGSPIDIGPNLSTQSIASQHDDSPSNPPRRAIITTGELRSRLKENKPPSDEK